MNREEAKKLLPIMQAYSEGKEVQVRDRGDDSWQTWDEYGFDSLRNMEYRIKPEPRAMYCNIDVRGNLSRLYNSAGISRKVAEKNGVENYSEIAIEFIEVME